VHHIKSNPTNFDCVSRILGFPFAALCNCPASIREYLHYASAKRAAGEEREWDHIVTRMRCHCDAENRRGRDCRPLEVRY
jgi:hypothetical protein